MCNMLADDMKEKVKNSAPWEWGAHFNTEFNFYKGRKREGREREVGAESEGGTGES